ncbi:MAG: hypothetical protein KAU14_08880 [Thermoplasmata archaeon]|nr:hypothetical protein [Thermoplasmata archaeon]
MKDPDEQDEEQDEQPGQLERTCINCNYFFPDLRNLPTEFGICLNDEAFEPFIEEMLDNENLECCGDLIDRKRFDGNCEACEDYEECETVDLKEDFGQEFAEEIERLRDEGMLTKETFQEALLRRELRSRTVEDHAEELQDTDPQERLNAVSSLAALTTFGNEDASRLLFGYFRELPPPLTLNEVHFKMEVFRHLSNVEEPGILVPVLVDELYNTPSNNTTKQWLSEIFRFFERCPVESIREPLKKMLGDRRFSYRRKQRMKEILRRKTSNELY